MVDPQEEQKQGGQQGNNGGQTPGNNPGGQTSGSTSPDSQNPGSIPGGQNAGSSSTPGGPTSYTSGTNPGNSTNPDNTPGALADNIEQRIHRRIRYGNGPRGGIWAGLFILLVGGVLLMDQMGFPLPDWLFSWHVLLIAIGLFIGLRHNFRGGAWAILMLVGTAFMLQDFYPHAQLHRFIWPCILIFVGLMIMIRPRRPWEEDSEWKREWKREWKNRVHNKYDPDWRERKQEWKQEWRDRRHTWHQQNQDWQQRRRDWRQQHGWGFNPHVGATTAQGYTTEDFVDSTSIFGGVHKKIVSKNFKGGDVVTILGGSEIDLSQADFVGTARLDVTQVMGGTKVIVPPHWEVRTEVSAIFAGFEDKRQQPAVLNPEKILIIDGTSIFGGIELKNF